MHATDASHGRKSSLPPDPRSESVVPSVHSARTLVLCFDGTGDTFKETVRCVHRIEVPARLNQRMSEQNSNVIQLFEMLKKDDKRKQMVYYQVSSGQV